MSRDSTGSSTETVKISVITAVFNGAATLARTIDSVAGQDYPDLEYIVIDGGSTDGSLEVLASRAGSIDHWISEADSGIADAMNKGIASSNGELLLFLHADDYLAGPDAVSRAMEWVNDTEHLWAFDLLFGEGSGQRRLRPRPFNAWAWFRNPLPHQGVLCPRFVFDRLGPFDARWRISMDYDFWLRAMAAGVQLERVGQTLSVMGSGGVSSCQAWAGLKARLDEDRAIQRVHARGWGLRLAYGLFWPSYLVYRRVRGSMWPVAA
jgi:glycosyltransferase